MKKTQHLLAWSTVSALTAGVALLFCVGQLSGQAAALDQPAVTGVVKPLWPGIAPGAKGTEDSDIPTLTAYLPQSNPTGTAVIIAPGGGYGHLSMQKEGEDVARWLNQRGVAGFVLKYRLGPKYHHPVELGDALRAIRVVRADAATYHVDPTHIGMWGFSAGGHLAASAGTLYEAGQSSSPDVYERPSSRPDFLILAYPVVTLEDPYVHKGSRDNLLGVDADAASLAALSPEKHVTKDTPPSFLFATTDDGTVPVMNSVLFYSL